MKVISFGTSPDIDKQSIGDGMKRHIMMGLVQKSLFVITDGGGLQKEAYFAGKRAIVVMPDTGWRELTDAGWNLLSRPDEIKSKMDCIVNNEIVPETEHIYGEGNAGRKIVEILSNTNV